MKRVLPLLLVLVSLLATLPGVAQEGLRLSGDVSDPAMQATVLRTLATDVIGAYKDDNRGRYLDTLFRLQIVAAQYEEATRTIGELKTLLAGSDHSAQGSATDLQYVVYAEARGLEAGGESFPRAFEQAFREEVPRLSDRTAALVMRELSASVAPLQGAFEQSVKGQGEKTTIAPGDAVALLRNYQVAEAYEAMAPLLPPLIAAEDESRFVIDRDVLVKTPDGAEVCVLVVRPWGTTSRLPALLNFTIYSDPVTMMNEARRTASNGYVGVEGMTRGKGCSPDAAVPYEHDGTDAAAVIDWISAQPWSDGRVGMYGGSYEGFTQWAAAKHMPKALKALMPSVSVAPGIDVPMEGNLFQTFDYYWPLYAASGHALNDALMNDRGRWRRMQFDWYASGRPYKDLSAIEGSPNPYFDKWLTHPSYDGYWQAMTPYKEEFSRINIPVLTTTGYYDDGQIGAVHYVTQHYRYNPRAEHYLIIGPYNHVMGQRGTVSLLGNAVTTLDGYALDPVAQIDLGELRYQWFDYVFKGAAKPAILKDRINYEVMGANTWRHVPSLGAMHKEMLRYHPSAEKAGEFLRLSQKADGSVVPLTVDLADRSDAKRMSPSSGEIVDRVLDTWNGIAFISEPFSQATELSGLFAGRLDFICNQRDFDIEVDLYERTAQGDYFQLSYFKGRASYLRDQSVRKLLRPNARERIPFTSGRLTSRRLEKGSQLVVMLSVVKSPFAQVNLGTGKDVSDESASDAKGPLTIRWLSSTWIDVPVSSDVPVSR